MPKLTNEVIDGQMTMGCKGMAGVSFRDRQRENRPAVRFARLVCRGKFFFKRNSVQNIVPACETRVGCSLETIISDELCPGCEVKT